MILVLSPPSRPLSRPRVSVRRVLEQCRRRAAIPRAPDPRVRMLLAVQLAPRTPPARAPLMVALQLTRPASPRSLLQPAQPLEEVAARRLALPASPRARVLAVWMLVESRPAPRAPQASPPLMAARRRASKVPLRSLALLTQAIVPARMGRRLVPLALAPASRAQALPAACSARACSAVCRTPNETQKSTSP